MNFIEALDQEIKALWQSLETDQRFLKVKQLERTRALYAADGTGLPPNGGALAATEGADVAKVTVSAPGRKMSPARKAALEATIAFLKTNPELVRTAEILKHLTASGVELGGTDPQNNLSALLHHSEEYFVSHGRAGWTLKKKGSLGGASEPS